MDRVRVSFEVDQTVLQALQHVAAGEAIAVGDLLRQAVDRDLYRRNRAKKAVQPDERLVAPLRALLANDLAYAADWADLQMRLRAKGYVLRESGGGLILARLPEGTRVAKASDLGYSYARLMRRFNALFPGHRYGRVRDRLD